VTVPVVGARLKKWVVVVVVVVVVVAVVVAPYPVLDSLSSGCRHTSPFFAPEVQKYCIPFPGADASIVKRFDRTMCD
jgi:hypothetical protein